MQDLQQQRARRGPDKSITSDDDYVSRKDIASIMAASLPQIMPTFDSRMASTAVVATNAAVKKAMDKERHEWMADFGNQWDKFMADNPDTTMRAVAAKVDKQLDREARRVDRAMAEQSKADRDYARQCMEKATKVLEERMDAQRDELAALKRTLKDFQDQQNSAATANESRLRSTTAKAEEAAEAQLRIRSQLDDISHKMAMELESRPNLAAQADSEWDRPSDASVVVVTTRVLA